MDQKGPCPGWQSWEKRSQDWKPVVVSFIIIIFINQVYAFQHNLYTNDPNFWDQAILFCYKPTIR